jgi:hypothetical protein
MQLRGLEVPDPLPFEMSEELIHKAEIGEKQSPNALGSSLLREYNN